MRNIVLAVDGSAHSLRAAWMAGNLSGAMNAPVNIIHVVPEGKHLVASDAVTEYSQMEHILLTQRDLLQAAGSQVVNKAKEIVLKAGGKLGGVEVLTGAAAQEIADYAKGLQADCIVMGRRGLGEVAGLFMGSVSHKVGQLTPITLVTTE